VLVLLLGLAVWGALWLGRFALDVAPISSRRRERLRRAMPVVTGAVVVLALFLATGLLFARYPAHLPYAVAVIAGVLALASWFAIRDVVSGVFVKAGRVCRVGDYVRVGDVSGRVERMGHRVLVVETAGGEEAIVPYSRLTRESVLRTPVAERGTLHVFELALQDAPPVAEAKRKIRESALSCHWAAVAREPEIAVIDENRFEVTVFAIDSDRVREVEAHVRASFSA
jgi:hypothetical protein